MNSTNRHIEVSKELDEVEIQIQDLYQKQAKLSTERQKLVANVLKENGLLKKFHWKYRSGSCRRATFCLFTDEDSENRELIKDLYRLVDAKWEHSSVPLIWELARGAHDVKWEECVEFRTDDGELRIVGKRDSDLFQFVKDFGIELDLTSLHEDKAKIEKSLNAIESLIVSVQNNIAPVGTGE